MNYLFPQQEQQNKKRLLSSVTDLIWQAVSNPVITISNSGCK